MPIAFFYAGNRLHASGELLTNLTNPSAAPINGTWVCLDRVHPFTISIEVDDNWTGTVRLHLSDAVLKPNDTESGATTQDFDGRGQASYDAPYKWVKTSIPTWTGGTLTRVGISARQ